MDELKERITQVVRELDPEMVKRAVKDIVKRARSVVFRDGGYIEKE